MPCAEADNRLQAYFDTELDAVAAAAFESHLASCGECRAALEELRSMRAALRSALPYERAPAALGTRISAALDRESQAAAAPAAAPLARAPRAPSGAASLPAPAAACSPVSPCFSSRRRARS